MTAKHHEPGHGAPKGRYRETRRRLFRGSRAQWSRLRRGTWHILRRKWVRRGLWSGGIAIGVVVLGVLGLWWRLSRGPIEIGMATPWLTAAISENFGGQHSVTVGGTQIERDERGRTALRILDIVVRDADGVIVASAPKADIGISGNSLMRGRLRAQGLNLVGAELSVRIESDGRVTVFAGANTRPIAVAPTPDLPKSQPAATLSDKLRGRAADLAAALVWIDGLGVSGLDGHGLDELGLKNGNLTVDDRRSGKQWTFSDINVSLSRPSGGGMIFKLESENPQRPWQLSAALRPLDGGIRAVGIEARQVSLNDLFLATRFGNGTIESDVPLSASMRGEFDKDGVLQHAAGQILATSGYIQDRDGPTSRFDIDHADIRFVWDGATRNLAVPFQITADGNQFTLLARLQPEKDQSDVWSFAIDRGDAIIDPAIFPAQGKSGENGFALNRATLRGRIDTAGSRAELTQGDIGRTDVRPDYNLGIALTGTLDWGGVEPKLSFGIAGTRMPLATMKRLWPVFVSPNVRRFVEERMSGGNVERVLIAANATLNVLFDPAVPFPDDSLSIEIESSGTTLQPVAKLPAIKDADLSVRVSGRMARVSLGRGTIEAAPGRKLNIANGSFAVPDTHPKPSPASATFRIDGAVAAAAQLLKYDLLRGSASAVLDPNASRGNVTAQVTVNLGLNKRDVQDVTYTINADLTNFAADNMLMGQKLEAQTLHVAANSGDLQISGDVKINGVTAALDFRQATGSPFADLRLRALLDETARRRFGIHFGSSVSGAIPVIVTGRVGSDDSKNQFNVDADFTAAKIDQLLPGWVKPAGKSAHATFNLVKTGKTTRFDDLTLEGQGALVKGSVELDATGDITAANFPVYALSGGDQVSLRVDRANDGTLQAQLRGDVYDGRQFVKSLLANEPPGATRQKQVDLDLDVRIGAVAGNNGEALRGLDLKMSRRAGRIRSFNMKAKIGRDTPLVGEIRLRPRDTRPVVYLETDDAGALFRFTDIYSRMYGGQMWMMMDPPSKDSPPQAGVLSIQNFAVRGEPGLDRAMSGAPDAIRSSVDFTELRCDFTSVPGQMTIRDGVLRGPTIGATIDGQIDYARDELRLHGTFVPMYGLNNMFGRIPIVGMFLGGGSNEGLVGITYEAVGPPGSPRININPISAVAPGLLRKFIPGPGGFESSPNRLQPNSLQPVR